MASSKRVTPRKVVATADKLARTENNKMAAGKSTKRVEKKIGSVMSTRGVGSKTMGRVTEKVGRPGEPNKKSGTPKPVRKEASKLMKAQLATDRVGGRAMAEKSPALRAKADKLSNKVGNMVQKASPAGNKKAGKMDAKDGGKTFLKARDSKKSPSFKKK
jgi:hypothetical protein